MLALRWEFNWYTFLLYDQQKGSKADKYKVVTRTADNISLTKHDYDSIKPNEWLNDNVRIYIKF